jgi:hypothetical protein
MIAMVAADAAMPVVAPKTPKAIAVISRRLLIFMMDPPLKIAPPPGATSGREFGINFCLLSINISFAALFNVKPTAFDNYSKPLKNQIALQIQLIVRPAHRFEAEAAFRNA